MWQTIKNSLFLYLIYRAASTTPLLSKLMFGISLKYRRLIILFLIIGCAVGTQIMSIIFNKKKLKEMLFRFIEKYLEEQQNQSGSKHQPNQQQSNQIQSQSSQERNNSVSSQEQHQNSDQQICSQNSDQEINQQDSINFEFYDPNLNLKNQNFNEISQQQQQQSGYPAAKNLKYQAGFNNTQKKPTQVTQNQNRRSSNPSTTSGDEDSNGMNQQQQTVGSSRIQPQNQSSFGQGYKFPVKVRRDGSIEEPQQWDNNVRAVSSQQQQNNNGKIKLNNQQNNAQNSSSRPSFGSYQMVRSKTMDDSIDESQNLLSEQVNHSSNNFIIQQQQTSILQTQTMIAQQNSKQLIQQQQQPLQYQRPAVKSNSVSRQQQQSNSQQQQQQKMSKLNPMQQCRNIINKQRRSNSVYQFHSCSFLQTLEIIKEDDVETDQN
eukprot:403345296